MSQHPESIIPEEMRGVQKITGYRGKGKSYYASTVEDPNLTAFMDFEAKGEGIENQLHFGLYVPVTVIAKGSAVAVWDVFLKEVDKMPQDRFTHVILDNTAPLETAMRAEAARNATKYAKQFGMDANNISANRYGGQGGVVNYLVSEELCNPLWAKGVKLITVTSHIKPRWQGGVQVVNSYNIKGADKFEELSILTLIIINGEYSPIPSALVYKEQLGEITYDKVLKKFARRRRLPYRLPMALPEEVARYIKEPADLKNPKAGEMPTDEELKPFREELSNEQLGFVRAEMEREKKQSEAAVVLDFTPDPNIARIKQLSATMSKPKIAAELGLTVPEVIRLSKLNGDAQ